ncbi:MAG: flagellum-specific ATP synthase FliI, partial [Alphaproteobacteria bacterium]
MEIGLEHLQAEVAAVRLVHDIGRVCAIEGGTFAATGLSHKAARGDIVEIDFPDGRQEQGEILALSGERAVILPGSGLDGLSIGTP